MYGTREIQFYHIVDKAFKHAYITVGFREGGLSLEVRQLAGKGPKSCLWKGKMDTGQVDTGWTYFPG